MPSAAVCVPVSAIKRRWRSSFSLLASARARGDSAAAAGLIALDGVGGRAFTGVFGRAFAGTGTGMAVGGGTSTGAIPFSLLASGGAASYGSTVPSGSWLMPGGACGAMPGGRGGISAAVGCTAGLQACIAAIISLAVSSEYQ